MKGTKRGDTMPMPSFSEMTTPALVVAGDADIDVTHYLTMRGADWFADPYRLSPSPKCLLILSGGKHGLGGIAGYDAKETTDENPERVAVLERLTWAYLRTALYPKDPAWPAARAALAQTDGLGHVECKMKSGWSKALEPALPHGSVSGQKCGATIPIHRLGRQGRWLSPLAA